jgi:hypothetical protein
MARNEMKCNTCLLEQIEILPSSRLLQKNSIRQYLRRTRQFFLQVRSFGALALHGGVREIEKKGRFCIIITVYLYFLSSCASLFSLSLITSPFPFIFPAKAYCHCQATATHYIYDHFY